MSYVRVSRSVLVVVSLFSLAAFAQAQEPLDIGGAGQSNTLNVTISSTTAVTLVTEALTNLSAAHEHTCNVDASAAVLFGGNGSYIFAITLDAVNQLASERRIEFTDNPDNDEAFKPVATNMTFVVSPGNHTFRFTARKAAASATNAVVDNSTISVTCVMKSID